MCEERKVELGREKVEGVNFQTEVFAYMVN